VAAGANLYRGIAESARFQAGLLRRARLVPEIDPRAVFP
jgi:hypothetical protein